MIWYLEGSYNIEWKHANAQKPKNICRILFAIYHYIIRHFDNNANFVVVVEMII